MRGDMHSLQLLFGRILGEIHSFTLLLLLLLVVVVVVVGMLVLVVVLAVSNGCCCWACCACGFVAAGSVNTGASVVSCEREFQISPFSLSAIFLSRMILLELTFTIHATNEVNVQKESKIVYL